MAVGRHLRSHGRVLQHSGWHGAAWHHVHAGRPTRPGNKASHLAGHRELLLRIEHDLLLLRWLLGHHSSGHHRWLLLEVKILGWGAAAIEVGPATGRRLRSGGGGIGIAIVRRVHGVERRGPAGRWGSLCPGRCGRGVPLGPCSDTRKSWVAESGCDNRVELSRGVYEYQSLGGAGASMFPCCLLIGVRVARARLLLVTLSASR